MTKPHITLSRRSFLLAATAGTAATAAATLKKHAGSAAGTHQRIESKSGYQLTEHVRNYYRTAKL